MADPIVFENLSPCGPGGAPDEAVGSDRIYVSEEDGNMLHHRCLQPGEVVTLVGEEELQQHVREHPTTSCGECGSRLVDLRRHERAILEATP